VYVGTPYSYRTASPTKPARNRTDSRSQSATAKPSTVIGSIDGISQRTNNGNNNIGGLFRNFYVVSV
jgi:hypothetical protein